MAQTKQTMIRVRRETRDKIDEIAKAKDWSIVTVIEKAVESLVGGERGKRSKKASGSGANVATVKRDGLIMGAR